MRKVIASTYATLDGKVDALQEWTIPYDDAAVAAYHDDLLANSDALLLGRKTYEIFAVIWPARVGSVAYGDKINTMAKYVASRTLEDLSWENSQLLDGDLARSVAELKEQPGGDVVVYSGGEIVQSLLEHGLLDEYRVMLHPVLLGKGIGLWPDGAKRVNLDLVDATEIQGGVVILTYRPV